MVFLGKDIHLFVKNFWPHRTKSKGFSIQNLARKYRLKISSSNFSSNEISNKLIDDSNFISMKKEGKNISLSNISIKGIHWANRDFSEYKEAA